MKKLFSIALLLLGTTSAMAQLPKGSVAPDFTVKDLNGNTYNLYTLLNQGKTVFLDVSAAWCAPCWAYHNSGALENLYIQHGPTGAPGVSTSTTNDVMVLFIEGESTNTTAQLHGTSTGTSYANFSQGDWVTGTPYPMVDSNASWTTGFDQAWQIGYFPTIYMICRDHLVQEVGQLTTAQLYAKAQQTCPTYGPSTTVDAKATDYSGSEFFYCNAAPTVKFQNYSQTQNITSATIKIYNGTSVVNTYNWTGNLAPYAVATVNIPPFVTNGYWPYKYEVTVASDSHPSNDMSADSLFTVYTASNALASPWSENFEASANAPGHFGFADGGSGLWNGALSGKQIKGTNGQITRGLYMDFYDLTANSKTEVVLGNFNTASATNCALDFDYAHGGYTGGENDKVEVMVSNDCGATWNSVWSKSGTALETDSSSKAYYVPMGSSSWKHGTALLTQYKGANMIVKLVGTSAYGNMAWFDNFKLTNTTSVASVSAGVNQFSVFPNPAITNATARFELSESSNVSIEVLDVAGRTVVSIPAAQMSAGEHMVNVPIANLSAGLYNVKVTTTQGSITERLSVVK